MVLSGGGPRGAAQAGAMVELVHAGLRPDLIIGTSIGAWNGAWLASHPAPAEAARLLEWWRDPDLARIFDRWFPLRIAQAMAWRHNAAISTALIDHLLAGAGFADMSFERLQLPLLVGAADRRDGELRYFGGGATRGPLLPYLRASSALPGVLDPVVLPDGHEYVDGGVLDPFGLAEAIRRGAGSVVWIDPGLPAREEAPRGVVANYDDALNIRSREVRRRSIAMVQRARTQLEVLEVGSGGPGLSFSRSPEGVEFGREAARAWLDGRPLPFPVWRPQHSPGWRRKSLDDSLHSAIREALKRLPEGFHLPVTRRRTVGPPPSRTLS